MFSLTLTPGNLLACTINAHRHGWNGVICDGPQAWACGADQMFRDSYCARGDTRCYQVRVFDEHAPRLIIDDNGAGWVLAERLDALDKQLLLLMHTPSSEPRGVRPGETVKLLAGLYVIDHCEPLNYGVRRLWKVVPSSWVRFPRAAVPAPRFRALAGPYLKEVAQDAFQRYLDDLNEAITPGGWWDPEDERRMDSFFDQLDDHLEKARAARAAAPQEETQSHLSLTSNPFAGVLGGMVGRPSSPQVPAPEPEQQEEVLEEAEVALEAATAHVSVLPAAAPVTKSVAPAALQPVASIVEPAQEPWVAANYGIEVLQWIKVGSLTKSLLILSGRPGVGKSYLATHLLDDPQAERTLVVPVASTWRGREDLLGYVNPVTAEFEPTAFTEFLFAAADAWANGDTRQRLVIFEEFNLSQPEHWLSDLLVVAEYRDPTIRRVQLGGSKVRGREDGSTSVPLSPGLKLVATINADHTTRPLSARVMDRAALVALEIDPATALQRTSVSVSEDQRVAIQDLDDILRSRGGFSMRTAVSLKACMATSGQLGLDAWAVIDLVLVQEVLSKLRLLARDPRDERLLALLRRWTEKHGAKLTRCASLIDEWSEALEADVDVIRA